MDVEGLDAEQVAERAMKIAAEICVYTNDNFVKEVRGVVFVVVWFWGGSDGLVLEMKRF